MSTLSLAKNGYVSSSKRTKHINARYFFVTDRISKGELAVKWCPTEDMTADFWTKPLQGASFRRMRDLIMGIVPQHLPRKSNSKRKKEAEKSEQVRPKRRAKPSHCGHRSVLDVVQ